MLKSSIPWTLGRPIMSNSDILRRKIGSPRSKMPLNHIHHKKFPIKYAFSHSSSDEVAGNVVQKGLLVSAAGGHFGCIDARIGHVGRGYRASVGRCEGQHQEQQSPHLCSYVSSVSHTSHYSANVDDSYVVYGRKPALPV